MLAINPSSGEKKYFSKKQCQLIQSVYQSYVKSSSKQGVEFKTSAVFNVWSVFILTIKHPLNDQTLKAALFSNSEIFFPFDLTLSLKHFPSDKLKQQ